MSFRFAGLINVSDHTHALWLYELWNAWLCIFLQPPITSYLLVTNNLITGFANTPVRHQSVDWKTFYVFGFQSFEEERSHVLWLLWREGRFWCQPGPAVSVFGKWSTKKFDVVGSNVPNNYAMADTMRNHDTSFTAIHAPRCNRRGRTLTEGWVRLHNEVHNLLSPPNVTRVINGGRVWPGRGTCRRYMSSTHGGDKKLTRSFSRKYWWGKGRWMD